MSQYNILASELLALASLYGADQEHCDRLREEDGELIEERTTPTDREEITVTQGVREATPAVYLRTKAKRVAFCLGPENDLRYYSCENDSDEWEVHPHAVATAINLHQQTKLAAGYTMPSNVNVFYQDNQGTLKCISSLDLQSWALDLPLTAAANPIEGTPLQALQIGDELRLYYLSGDRFFHYISFSSDIGDQIDHTVDYANIGEYKVKHFIAHQLAESEVTLFLLGEDSSVTSYSPNAMIDIGKFTDTGDLELANKDEMAFCSHNHICIIL